MPKHDVTNLETRIKELTKTLTQLTTEQDFQELIQIIHRPGWTTPAEFAFATGIVDTMLAQAKALTNLKQALLAGSREVTAKEAARA